MSRRRSSPATAPPLEDEDLLQEILLRLPPNPSSLPRASVVCKRWRRILSDPKFLRRFRKHHRTPPLLGFFKGCDHTKHVFTPILDPPDRIPTEHFSMPKSLSPFDLRKFVGCRHSLAVLVNVLQSETVVWDPLTGQQHCVAFPPGLDNALRGSLCTWHGAVLCADAEDGHVHGDCFSSPFKLVLVCAGHTHAFGSLYDSASGVWGKVYSTATTDAIFGIRLSILVRNELCWLIYGGDVLVFDFEMQSLDVIEKPADNHVTDDYCFQLLRMEDGALGLAVLSELTIQLWERKSDTDGVVGWALLQKTIPLEGMFQWRMPSDHKTVVFVGYDEDTNVIVLSTKIGNFMLQLDSKQIKHIIKRNKMCYDILYPYSNFYTAGRGVGWKWFNLEL